MNFEHSYLNAIENVLHRGHRRSNRTGIDTLYKLGFYLPIDLSKEFPLLTTKKVNWQSAFAEMLGFIRGYENAEDFRNIGTKVWDANANENKTWLKNPNRIGRDDLGRIYGAQWRRWRHPLGFKIDQFRNVYTDLLRSLDNRREIILGWNPGELDQMALPPCHMMMQFGFNADKLDLLVYIRSNDMGLGMPFNMAQYGWLLLVMAKITNNKPGTLHYFAFNYHIYVNHIPALEEQLKRSPRESAIIEIRDICDSLEFLESTDLLVPEWTKVMDYDPYPSIKMTMAV